MIRMEQPSFSFNSSDVGVPHYTMWKTIVGPAGMTPSQLVAEIVVANNASLQVYGKSLRNIILNTHGGDGSLSSFTPTQGMRKGIDPEKDVWTVQEPIW